LPLTSQPQMHLLMETLFATIEFSLSVLLLPS
jgi:hypothetical protein